MSYLKSVADYISDLIDVAVDIVNGKGHISSERLSLTAQLQKLAATLVARGISIGKGGFSLRSYFENRNTEKEVRSVISVIFSRCVKIVKYLNDRASFEDVAGVVHTSSDVLSAWQNGEQYMITVARGEETILTNATESVLTKLFFPTDRDEQFRKQVAKKFEALGNDWDAFASWLESVPVASAIDFDL